MAVEIKITLNELTLYTGPSDDEAFAIWREVAPLLTDDDVLVMWAGDERHLAATARKE
jgi:hypothetical protein